MVSFRYIYIYTVYTYSVCYIVVSTISQCLFSYNSTTKWSFKCSLYRLLSQASGEIQTVRWACSKCTASRPRSYHNISAYPPWSLTCFTWKWPPKKKKGDPDFWNLLFPGSMLNFGGLRLRIRIRRMKICHKSESWPGRARRVLEP